MGNESVKSKNPSASPNFTSFKRLSHGKKSIVKNDLKVAWMSILDESLYEILESYLCKSNETCPYELFDDFASSLTRGTFNEKADLILGLHGNDCSLDHPILEKFILGVIRSVVRIESSNSKKSYDSWKFAKLDDFSRLTSHLLTLNGLKVTYTSQDISAILPSLDPILTITFSAILSNEGANLPSLVPKWVRLVSDAGKKIAECSLLTMEDILFINSELPVDFQREWRLLFSTKLHGESFSRFSGQITNQGPTLLILRDKDQHVFGAYCPANWSMSPNFVGDSSCFVFTLRPEMTVYSASNYNSNFQYLNVGQQTLPNGLGLGGRLEYFGLWLDAEFGAGVCNESCTTYRNFKRLSRNKEFAIDSLEVWGVGKPPPTAAELGERSVLDGNSEVKAILEMAGRKTYSDGLRDEPED